MYRPLNAAQAKQFIDARHSYEGLRDALLKANDYVGGMHWKTVKDHQYLYRTTDRHGNAKSLGRRSPETEQMMLDFMRRKSELVDRMESLEKICATNAKINQALELGSVPNEVADVCEMLDRKGLMGKAITVIGTNSMHVYESLAGVRFDSSIMATVDIDLLWNHKTKLSLASTQAVSHDGLIGLLKKVDSSYEIDSSNAFRARSKRGFMVDLIRQMPDPPWADEPDRFFASGDLVATDIRNMNWLLGAPREDRPAVAMDGRMVRMVAPDPRAFAMFKVWLSQAADREPVKRERDLEQARAVIQLIHERLPMHDNWGAIKSFPAEVMERTEREVARMRPS